MTPFIYAILFFLSVAIFMGTTVFAILAHHWKDLPERYRDGWMLLYGIGVSMLLTPVFILIGGLLIGAYK